jgi:hypothetical protein
MVEKPIALSDTGMTQIMAACRPLSPIDRARFLQLLAERLNGKREVGDGEVYRLVRELQRELLPTRCGPSRRRSFSIRASCASDDERGVAVGVLSGGSPSFEYQLRSGHLQWSRNVRTKGAFNSLHDMESHHHHRSKRLRTKRSINVLRSPCATVDEIADRHDGLDKLDFQPFLNVRHYFSIDGRIAAGIKFLGEESYEVAIAAEVAICFYYLAAEGIADNFSREIV